MNDGHYSDDRLIAFLDGELHVEAARDVGAHLDRCWPCRARCQELERGIALVGGLFREADQALGDSVHRMRKPLFAALNQNPGSHPSGRSLRNLRPLFFFAAALAAAAAVTRLVVLMPDRASVAAPVKPVKPRPPVVAPAIPEPAPVAAPLAARVNPPLPLPKPAAAEPAETIVPIDLDEVELELRFRLHQSGADLRDGAIRIGQQEGVVVVHGVVDSPAQGLELLQAAAAVPRPDAVRVDLRLASEVVGPATAVVSQETAPPVSRAERPLLKTLVLLLGSEARLTERGNQAVATVEKMTDTAWALRHLHERFGAKDALSVRSQELLGSIENDYRARIRSLGGDLRTQLEFLPGWSAAQIAASTDPATQVFTVRDLVEWLFAGRQLEPGPGSIEEAARSIATQLGGLQTSPEESSHAK